MTQPLIEICAGSIASALAAQEGGANRIELCDNLSEGGTTPSIGMITTVKKLLQIPVYVLIRPRAGDFLYTDAELDSMEADIDFCKIAGVDGFVFGVLDADGNVDEERNRRLIETAYPLPCTFHRAFDVCASPFDALEAIIECGFTRLLSSGQQASAPAGAALLGELVKRAGDRLIIMPGGGIREENAAALVKETRAVEYHASMRSATASGMKYRNENVKMGSAAVSEYEWQTVDVNRVKELVRIAREAAAAIT